MTKNKCLFCRSESRKHWAHYRSSVHIKPQDPSLPSSQNQYESLMRQLTQKKLQRFQNGDLIKDQICNLDNSIDIARTGVASTEFFCCCCGLKYSSIELLVQQTSENDYNATLINMVVGMYWDIQRLRVQNNELQLAQEAILER